MKKYLQILKFTFAEFSAYRLNFYLWRFRQVLSFLIIYFFYFALFAGGGYFGYTKEKMITYILGISLLRALVMSSRTIDLGSIIADGNLANYLIRPLSFFKYWFARDAADKLLNLGFSIVELTILFFILKPQIFIQNNLLLIALLLIAIVMSVLLYFFINVLLGIVAFWTPDSWSGVWAPRFLFFIMMEFFSGTLFPLDFLPKNIFFLFSLTPFPYLVYFPLQIYLGNASYPQIFQGFTIFIFWTIFLYLIVRKTWGAGLKIFSAEGR